MGDQLFEIAHSFFPKLGGLSFVLSTACLTGFSQLM